MALKVNSLRLLPLDFKREVRSEEANGRSPDRCLPLFTHHSFGGALGVR